MNLVHLEYRTALLLVLTLLTKEIINILDLKSLDHFRVPIISLTSLLNKDIWHNFHANLSQLLLYFLIRMISLDHASLRAILFYKVDVVTVNVFQVVIRYVSIFWSTDRQYKIESKVQISSEING